MKDTVKLMLESDFGFGTEEYSQNKEILEGMNFISEEVRQMTGFVPEKVIVLNDNDNYYIEFANNLERLMSDGDLDLQEALDMVTACNKIAACDVNIIVDESSVDRIDIDKMIKIVGAEHVFRK